MAKKQTKSAATAPPTAAETDREYSVVARRYRPQQFAELIGQGPVCQALTNAIQAGRVAHAYLFTGARGVGKTSAARIFAKALNCAKGPTITPCDECASCKAIAAGEDIDVQEIDGASNRGIEDIRAIRSNVASRPQHGRYKMYIIDEVHMLTKEAFNALLKTLEEPPPHVKFIFATTEVNKIPITILSRCQRFDFGTINTNRILERLREVLAGEGMTAEDEALRIVARRGAGSMRDAQSLLEQLLSFGGDRLTAETVHSMLGTSTDDRVVELATAVLSNDSTRALELVAKGADEGLQLGELVDQLMQYWRGLMLVNCSEAELANLDIADHHRETVQKQAKSATLDTILAGLDVLATTKQRMRTTSHSQVLVEMAVVRLSRLDELIPITQLVQSLQAGGPAVTPAGALRSTAPSASQFTVSDSSKKNGSIGLADRFKGQTNGELNVSGQAPSVTPISDANLSLIWDKVKAESGMMLTGMLNKAGIPAILGPKTLALRFPVAYNHEYEFCRDTKNADTVERTIRRVTGQEWSIRYEQLSTPAAAEPSGATVSNKERERNTLELPLLARIGSVLQGRLLHMDPGFGENAPDDEVPEPLPFEPE